MRPIEALLICANLLTFSFLLVPRLRVIRWIGYSAPAGLLVAIVQVSVEGPRWQMVPAYALSIIFFLLWLNRRTSSSRLHMIRFKRLIAGLGIGSGILAMAVSAVLPSILPVFHFPRPSGPYQIGTLIYHWTESRHEIFSTDPTARRQLMAQVWYPVTGDKSAMRVPYVQDAGAVSSTFGRSTNLPGFILDQLRYVTTNAIPSAPMASTKASYPVLIFLTGVVGFRQQSTFQIENLASHGYIVVGLDQPYAAAAVTFPNGQVIPGWTRDQIQPLINQSLSAAKQTPAVNGHAIPDGIIPYLARDVSFTLNRLASLNTNDPDGILTGRLDLQHVGIFGISLGAIVASEACHMDIRLKACLLMDAAMPANVVQARLKQSAMWLTRPASDMRLEKWKASDITQALSTMRAVYDKEPAGDGYYVEIPGMFHVNFTDAPYYSPIAHVLGLSGPINAQRGFDIVNAYTMAFFNKVLQQQSSPLLSGQSKQFSDVIFETH